MDIQILELTLYNYPYPPSGRKYDRKTMNIYKLSVEMYLWKKDMDMIYDTKKNDRENIHKAYGVAIRKFT